MSLHVFIFALSKIVCANKTRNFPSLGFLSDLPKHLGELLPAIIVPWLDRWGFPGNRFSMLRLFGTICFVESAMQLNSIVVVELRQFKVY